MTDSYTLDQKIQQIAAHCKAAGKLSLWELKEIVHAALLIADVRPSPDQIFSLGRLSCYLGLDPMLTERLMQQPGSPLPFDENLWRAGDIYRWLDQHENAVDHFRYTDPHASLAEGFDSLMSLAQIADAIGVDENRVRNLMKLEDAPQMLEDTLVYCFSEVRDWVYDHIGDGVFQNLDDGSAVGD